MFRRGFIYSKLHKNSLGILLILWCWWLWRFSLIVRKVNIRWTDRQTDGQIKIRNHYLNSLPFSLMQLIIINESTAPFGRVSVGVFHDKFITRELVLLVLKWIFSIRFQFSLGLFAFCCLLPVFEQPPFRPKFQGTRLLFWYLGLLSFKKYIFFTCVDFGQT